MEARTRSCGASSPSCPPPPPMFPFLVALERPFTDRTSPRRLFVARTSFTAAIPPLSSSHSQSQSDGGGGSGEAGGGGEGEGGSCPSPSSLPPLWCRTREGSLIDCDCVEEGEKEAEVEVGFAPALLVPASCALLRLLLSLSPSTSAMVAVRRSRPGASVREGKEWMSTTWGFRARVRVCV